MATLQHTDELYHILEDEICALKILPGEALSENQLCKRFGVSRTPIRSVLQRLEQNRFVQIIPCKGTIVTAIDTGVVDQLIFQRVAVEGMVFRDFVQSCSPMEILAVEHLYNMLLEAAAGRSDPENFDFNHFLSCDLAMHEYWFHKTSKEYLWEQMTRPQADYSRFIRLDIVGGCCLNILVNRGPKTAGTATTVSTRRKRMMRQLTPRRCCRAYTGRRKMPVHSEAATSSIFCAARKTRKS